MRTKVLSGAVLLFVAVTITVTGVRPASEASGDRVTVTGSSQDAEMTVADIGAATSPVNSTDDSDDGACDAAHCSLREAINAADANPGIDTIAFNIPGAGPHTIQPATVLPMLTDTILDGYTQPGASPNTNPPELGLNTVLKIELDGSDLEGASAFERAGLILGGNSIVRGLVINRCSYGVAVSGSNGNAVEGNFLGTDVTGTTALSNFFGVAIFSWAADNVIGGPTYGASNLISGNQREAVHIDFSQRTLVQNNLIGTDRSGANELGNGPDGIRLEGADDNTLAGNVVAHSGITFFGGDGNTVTGNTITSNRSEIGMGGDGIHVSSPASGYQILSNYVATNDRIGIALNQMTDSVVRDNVILSNGSTGIYLGSGLRNAIRANSIYGNGDLGIDLGGGGVAPNDPGDGDTGANGLQNYPVLTSLVNAAGSTTVGGILNSTPNMTFTLEFFSSGACDPSGHGEGETFILSTTVKTDANGEVDLQIAFPVAVPRDRFVTATATDPDDNTSEFSNCACADLAIAKTDSAERLLVGEVLTYTVMVANGGPLNATEVAITDTLPADVSLISISASLGTCHETGTVPTNTIICNVDTITVGTGLTVTIAVTPMTGGIITNTASARGNEPDPDTANNGDTASTVIISRLYLPLVVRTPPGGR